MEIGDCTRFIPRGWMCPVCGRVYAPDFPFCTSCGGNDKTVTTDHVIVGDTPGTMKDLFTQTRGPEK